MAGSKSNYLENALLDHVLGSIPLTPPSVVYVALSSANYAEAATGASMNELAGGATGYARVAVTNNLTSWPPSGTSSTKQNGVTITFPAATAAWVEARSFYLVDALSGGNILYGGDLTTPRTLLVGDTASFGPGAIIITED